MAKPESAGRESTLARLSRGVHARVVAIDAGQAPALAGHGIHVGARLVVQRDAPFRGPRIVGLRGTRMAVPHSIAALIRVLPEERHGGPAE